VDGNIAAFVRDLQTSIRAFGIFYCSTKNSVPRLIILELEVRFHRTCKPEKIVNTTAYTDCGRLAFTFLDEYLEH